MAYFDALDVGDRIVSAWLPVKRYTEVAGSRLSGFMGWGGLIRVA
jgi:hypothetical protein